jgi:hypothetical protein
MTRKQKTVLICLGLAALYSIIPDVQVNLLNNGQPSRSKSAYESRRRDVYLGDIQIIGFQTTTGISSSCLEDGWTEKAWATGRWYYSAHVNEFAFNTILVQGCAPDKLAKFKFRSRDVQPTIELRCCCGEICSGKTTGLPKDTVVFDVYQSDEIGQDLVVGKLTLYFETAGR